MFTPKQALIIIALATAFLTAATAAGENSLTDQEVAAWVRKRVRDWQPTAADRPFDQIGWAKDIRDAERLAREHDRPVFLFTHDGHIATGRC